MENVNQFIDDYVLVWSINIVGALLIYVIGKIISKLIVKGLQRVMEKGGVDTILKNFLSSVAYAALLVTVVIMALGQLGVNTTSALAIFGAAGLAIGLSLQSTLSNFAAGVMLIFFKPFKIGDFIHVGGSSGVVDAITVFNTKMHTPDNQEITIPNAQIYGGTIVNVSALPTRRIDLIIGIGYDDDIRKAKEILEGIIRTEDRILKDPPAIVAVGELGDSSINLVVRPWVNTANYWPTRFDLLEKIKVVFDANGISIPYPQRDVHLFESGKKAA